MAKGCLPANLCRELYAGGYSRQTLCHEEPAHRKEAVSGSVGVLYRRQVNFYRSRVGPGWLAQETQACILVRATEE
jgi:hypothetical protein